MAATKMAAAVNKPRTLNFRVLLGYVEMTSCCICPPAN